MEEAVGKLWDRLITRVAAGGFPAAAVTLEEMERPLGVLFRALGGDGGLRIEAAGPRLHGARRGLVQRVAGSHRKAALPWRDGESLRLPPLLSVYPDAALNRDLYLWLAALAGGGAVAAGESWVAANQAATLTLLAAFPGLEPRYRRLVAALLPLRPDPARLPPDEAAQEAAVQRALLEPGSVARPPAARVAPQPVPLWLYPPEGEAGGQPATTPPAGGDEEGGGQSEAGGQRRYRAERVAGPERRGGLMVFRLESLFSWSEFVKVDRETDEEEDPAAARAAAEELERLGVARDGKRVAARLRLDLDLPAVDEENLQLSDGVLLPEWDFKRQRMQRDHCRLIPLVAARSEPAELPARLLRPAALLRRQFQALAPARHWLRGQEEGEEVDLDGWLGYAAERTRGAPAEARGLYRALRPGARDLACLLLADLSLSTDAWLGEQGRVIDVIRDALLLFGEALAAVGDPFALYGFSSKQRHHVRYHTLKEFGERFGGVVRGRIESLRPGYYTRLGAAIRHSAALLERQPAGRRLLLILTDGKPNDLDRYEGRYGIEDTRAAVQEVRAKGLHPFCVTIDPEGNRYLNHLFGPTGYAVLHRPEELPRRLPALYARLTRG